MMYSGTPGSGKSLNAARYLLFKARLGVRIVANFSMVPTKKQIKKGRLPEHWENDAITPDKLLEYAKKYHKYGKESQTILVLDECQLMFNSREFRAKDRPEWIAFFSKHRHYGFDVLLITQHDRLIDRQVRAFIEYNVIHRKLNRFGIPGVILTLFRIKLFVAVTMWYGLRERCGAEYFFYRKKYGRLYDSYQDFSLGGASFGGEGPAPAGGDLPNDTPQDDSADDDAQLVPEASPAETMPPAGDDGIAIQADEPEEKPSRPSALRRAWTFLNRPIYLTPRKKRCISSAPEISGDPSGE